MIDVLAPQKRVENRRYLPLKTSFQHIKFSKKEAVAVVCEQVAAAISKSYKNTLTPNSGLYLVSSDAGIKSSVAFWKEAIEHGPGLVGPRLFPWTLANGPATCLARKLGLNGANITLVGGLNMLQSLQEMAMDDLDNGRTKDCLVIYFCLSDGEAFVYRME